MRFAAFTCILNIALLLAAPTHGAANSISLDEYKSIVAKTAEKLEYAGKLEKTRPGSSLKMLDDLSASIPSTVDVRSQNGAVTADLSWVKDEIKKINKASVKDRPDRLKELHQKVLGLNAAAEGTFIKGASRDQAKEILDGILKRNEYKESWLDKLNQRIQRALAGLLSKLNISEGTLDVIGWAIVVIAVITFVAAVVWLVLRIIGYHPFRRRNEQQEEAKQHIKPVRRSLESVLAAAEQEASQGNYREAFRYTYLATILLLDKARLVTYADSGTNWEYLQMLRRQSRPEMTNIFQSMTAKFDQLVYGKGSIGQSDYIESREHYRSLEAAV